MTDTASAPVQVLTRHSAGTICWADLGTPDMDGARATYRELLGWQFDDVPLDSGRTYTLATADGKLIAGMYAIKEPSLSSWDAYICVDDADAVVEMAQSLGGTIISPAHDTGGVARMATIQDPTGATFCIWQPTGHAGAQVLRTTGALTWCELLTRDLEAACTFYRELLGWTTSEQADVGGYRIFELDGQHVAGLMMLDETMEAIPESWLCYFRTDDGEAAAATIEHHGGAILVPPTSIEGVGRFLVAADANGAVMGLLEPGDHS